MAHSVVAIPNDSWVEVADAADVIELMQAPNPTGVRFISQTADPASTNAGDGFLLKEGDFIANWTLTEKLWARSARSRAATELVMSIR